METKVLDNEQTIKICLINEARQVERTLTGSLYTTHNSEFYNSHCSL